MIAFIQLNKYTLIFFAIFVLVACSIEGDGLQENEANVPVYSIENLAPALPALSAKPSGIFDPPGFIGPYHLEPLLGGGYIATNDRLEKMIHLFDETGTYLASAGGEGRGPGEFMGAMNLHAGWDNDLYVLDIPHHRITRFNVRDKELIYDTTYPVSREPGSLLRNIYVTPWGNFGVIQSNLDYSTGEEVYHLYELDKSFNPDERLIEMPGNEKMALSEWNHVEKLAGQKTFWDLDGEWFYYINSHSTKVHRYNLRTGETSAETFFALAERVITPEIRNHLIEYSSNMINRFPDLRKTMEAVTVLPLFQEFMVNDGNLYLVIFNVERSERTQIIRINEATGDVHYADIPHKLWRVQAGNGMIYGIEETEEESNIRMVKLSE